MSKSKTVRKRNQWAKCLVYFKNRCAYCGRRPSELSKDHFVPKSLGGSNKILNIVPSCVSCNSAKSNKSPHKWCSKSQIKRVQQYQKDLGYGSGNQNNRRPFSSDRLHGKYATFDELYTSYNELKKMIRKSRCVMITCNFSNKETHFFKVTKKEAYRFIDQNKKLLDEDEICFKYEGQVLCLG